MKTRGPGSLLYMGLKTKETKVGPGILMIGETRDPKQTCPEPSSIKPGTQKP